MKFASYVVLSTLAAAVALVSGWLANDTFFRTALYVQESKVAVAILMNFGFMVALLLGKLCVFLYLGTMSDGEYSFVLARLRMVVPTLLVTLLIFRTHLGPETFIMLGLWLFCKAFLYLAAVRVDLLALRHNPTWKERTRVAALLGCVLGVSGACSAVLFVRITDTSDFRRVYDLFWDGSFASSQGQFWLDFSVMCIGSVELIIRSMLLTVARWRGQVDQELVHRDDADGGLIGEQYTTHSTILLRPAPAGSCCDMFTWVFLTHFLFDCVSLFCYCMFAGLLMVSLGFPMFFFWTEVFATMRRMWVRTGTFRRMLQLSRHMDVLFPNATAQQLEECGECIICLHGYEEDGTGDVGKVLECGHVFHKRCLQLWLNADARCPLCRHAVDLRRRSATANDAPAPAAEEPPVVVDPPAAAEDGALPAADAHAVDAASSGGVGARQSTENDAGSVVSPTHPESKTHPEEEKVELVSSDSGSDDLAYDSEEEALSGGLAELSKFMALLAARERRRRKKKQKKKRRKRKKARRRAKLRYMGYAGQYWMIPPPPPPGMSPVYPWSPLLNMQSMPSHASPVLPLSPVSAMGPQTSGRGIVPGAWGPPNPYMSPWTMAAPHPGAVPPVGVPGVPMSPSAPHHTPSFTSEPPVVSPSAGEAHP